MHKKVIKNEFSSHVIRTSSLQPELKFLISSSANECFPRASKTKIASTKSAIKSHTVHLPPRCDFCFCDTHSSYEHSFIANNDSWQFVQP
jgi:hypothetical protein